MGVTILFIPLSASPHKLETDWAGDCDQIILPQCPVCEHGSIVGHGRRRKQAHDEYHDWIEIRRGRCPGCGKTFTFLPLFSFPYTHYSLLARCQALRRRFVEESLRRRLTAQGYSFDLLRQFGLLNSQGADAFYQRIVFPVRDGQHIVNLYGRSIGNAFAHRFLPGSKGGLYAWEQVQQCSQVILVEGLFDYAVLWQAGFHNLTCSLGTHLNADQFRQLCDRPRTVYLTFDVDANHSGQHAAQQLAHRLGLQGIATRRVFLPQGHDPNSFFVQGGDAQQFQSLLEAAQ